MDVLAGLDLGVLGATGLLAITVLLILRGWLVPKATVDRLEREADKWREAYMNERDARGGAEAQTTELLTLARATNALLAAIPRPGGQ